MHIIYCGMHVVEQIEWGYQLRALEDHDLSILNSNRVPTYIDERHGTTSCLDLCIVPSTLVLTGNMVRLGDLGSDHFSMLTFIFGGEKCVIDAQPKWK